MPIINRIVTALTVAPLALLGADVASAHGDAGDREFPATLTIDDPSVGDELSLPTFTSVTDGAHEDTPPTHAYGYGFEWDKRITEDLAVAVSDTYNAIHTRGQASAYGWDNLTVGLKYQLFVDAPHEVLASIGVTREFGGTGAQRVGAGTTGSTTPTVYVGKGFGDLPDSFGALRALAITSEASYQIADVHEQRRYDGSDNVYSPDAFGFGFSVQYDFAYLKAQIIDYGLPDFVDRLIPLVEFAYSTPVTSPHGTTTTGTIAPGLLYEGDAYQLGIEALIPATRASGNRTGFIAQAHFYLDDLFPATLGKPLF